MLTTQIVVVIVHIDEGTVGHGDNALARVAVDSAKCSHLLHVDVLQARQIV